jgi:DNA-binding NarL/FixJ family response regulator/tetratricopeptide (TPR) repeat protein
VGPERADDEILQGTRALERGSWAAARAAFEAALAGEASAEAWEGLGLAVWFEGRPDEGIALRERAFAAYVKDERCDQAARIAVWVSHQHLLAGRPSAARGWLARADRALDDAEPCVGHGWVSVERARHATSVDDQIRHATRAVEVARAQSADDLEVFAISLLGRAEINAGRREPGLLLLEEAMAAATAGRVRDLHTLSEAYCNLIMACADAGEWERADEWCQHVEAFARDHRAAPLFGACRTVHADVLLATGHWPEAEQALEAALATHDRYIPEMSATTVASLAELRVRQGRLGLAEEVLAGREEHSASLRALAVLRIAEGRPREAATLLTRGLLSAAGDEVRSVQLLAALTDAQLAGGDVEAAAAAADQLAGIAAGSGMRIARARAELAAARVLMARGLITESAEPARRALAEFRTLNMPLDAGEARLELARALTAAAPEIAADEARTSLAAFRSLGAQRAVDAATAFLRSLGHGAPGRPRVAGELTAREQEVLALVAMGMSNAQIASTLTISGRTAGHHVSRILTKLGVRNRAEAAAYAARNSS